MSKNASTLPVVDTPEWRTAVGDAMADVERAEDSTYEERGTDAHYSAVRDLGLATARLAQYVDVTRPIDSAIARECYAEYCERIAADTYADNPNTVKELNDKAAALRRDAADIRRRYRRYCPEC